MTIVDGAILFFLVFFVIAGVQRGYIGELFDVIGLILGTCIAFLLFFYIGGIVKGITGYESRGMYIFMWILVFVTVLIVSFLIGRRLDEKMSVDFPQKWWKILGGTLGAVKGFLVFFSILTLLGNVITSKNAVPLFKNSALVRTIQDAEPLFESVVLAVSPGEYEPSIGKYMKNSVFIDKK